MYHSRSECNFGGSRVNSKVSSEFGSVADEDHFDQGWAVPSPGDQGSGGAENAEYLGHVHRYLDSQQQKQRTPAFGLDSQESGSGRAQQREQEPENNKDGGAGEGKPLTFFEKNFLGGRTGDVWCYGSRHLRFRCRLDSERLRGVSALE